jgi:glucose-1-phosphate thymidylyltransferase
MKIKGIILAGGNATRLQPLSLVVSKQLLGIYDKPMIYYPLNTLISAGISEILIICKSSDLDLFKQLLGDGSKLGCNFEYAIQDNANGLAEAFVLGEEFIAEADRVCLILGDNIFYGSDINDKLIRAKSSDNAVIFSYRVKDPERYGVVESKDGKVISIIEKPSSPKSNYAITGLYIYPKDVVLIAKQQQPSNRGELEITDTNMEYLRQNRLDCYELKEGTAWLDTGTFDSMLEASNFVQTIQKRQGIAVGCIEVAAYKSGLININELQILANKYTKSGYSDYIKQVVNTSSTKV